MRGQQKDPHAVMEKCAKELGVFVRPAKLSDASQLIHLNKHFRYEMMQWEAAFTCSQECEGYPVLDFDDVQYILDEEDPKNLMVIGRKLEVEERIVGYSYSYVEPWEATTQPHTTNPDGPAAPCLGIMSPRPNRGKGSRKGILSTSAHKDGHVPNQDKQSLYIAELFISDSERGLGLGELLLTQTLRVHMSESTRSHLFVSSQNVGAVRCYLKFGYQKASKPSGDLAHDLVMELPECGDGVLSAAGRFEQQLNSGLLGARKRRPPPTHKHKTTTAQQHHHTSTHSTRTSPPKLIGLASKASHTTSSAAQLRSASASPCDHNTESRASSRSTVRGCNSPDVTVTCNRPDVTVVTHCPRATRARRHTTAPSTAHDDHMATPQRMATTRQASKVSQATTHSPCLSEFHQTADGGSNKRSPFMSSHIQDLVDRYKGLYSPLSIIQGRQRKATRLLRSRDSIAKRATTSRGKKGDNKGAVGKDPKDHDAAVSASPASDESHHQTRNTNRFMITLFSDGKRRVAEEQIRALGGEIVTSEHYDPSCTHVVSARPATTEKYLCAVAAGKYVMHPSYIEESVKHGAFLPEADFEWSTAVDAIDGDAKEKYGMALAKASDLWRPDRRQVRKKCFEGMICVLLSTTQRGEGFKRILEAGGAVVCADAATATQELARTRTRTTNRTGGKSSKKEERRKTTTQSHKDDHTAQAASVTESLLPASLRGQDKTITHVFVNKDIYELPGAAGWDVDRLHTVLPVLSELRDKGARFLFEEFIVERIAHNLNARHNASRQFVVDVDSWLENEGLVPRVGSKRKATA